ncbi:MAG: sterol desaturase/sphingolipid hydroxylase (fatty acid hydroxylase superfamily) [Arcticibacterium sp.]|jgi:sterol desaturase/sphingolipid hydroxylase (fatty acid hydroxylase superfamily)/CDGSH-type Zn-finger protein
MNQALEFLAEHSISSVIVILFFFGVLEAVLGYFSNSKRSKDDLLIETVNALFLFAITKPGVVLLSIWLMNLFLGKTENLVSGNALWLNLVIFLLVDDFLQYWYHRTSHKYKWLWKWHRPHHAATEMGLLVSYREAIFYFMLMPNIWWLGVFTFMGGGVAVAAGIVIKQIVVISSHSLITWDSVFYNKKWLLPIIKVIERILITPAFHHAHHAKSNIDDIGHPTGNFGNLFSFWDQSFGSAKFTHAFPESYGLQNDQNESWAAHSFYPIVASKKEGSEISREFTFEKTTRLEPTLITLSPGNYLYCTCGHSKTQPFCDGSHHGTAFTPEKFTIKKEREYKLCTCKLNKKGPFCDDSHTKA